MHPDTLFRDESRTLVLDLLGLFDAHPDIDGLTLGIGQESGYMSHLSRLDIQTFPGRAALPDALRNTLYFKICDLVADGVFTPLGEYFLEGDIVLRRATAAGDLQAVYDDCFGRGTWAKDEAAAQQQHLDGGLPDPDSPGEPSAVPRL
jgi:hypothetical protein